MPQHPMTALFLSAPASLHIQHCSRYDSKRTHHVSSRCQRANETRRMAAWNRRWKNMKPVMRAIIHPRRLAIVPLRMVTKSPAHRRFKLCKQTGFPSRHRGHHSCRYPVAPEVISVHLSSFARDDWPLD